MFRDNLLANNHWLTLSSSTFRLVSKTEKTVFCYLDKKQTNHLQHLVYNNTPTWLIKFYDRQYQMLYISLKKCHKMPQTRFLGDQNNLHPSPLAFPIQSWDVFCLLQVVGTEGQHCKEEVEEAKLNFSLFLKVDKTPQIKANKLSQMILFYHRLWYCIVLSIFKRGESQRTTFKKIC